MVDTRTSRRQHNFKILQFDSDSGMTFPAPVALHGPAAAVAYSFHQAAHVQHFVVEGPT
jgi:hypothetical protein